MSANRYRFVFIRHVGSPVRASVMSSSRGHGNAALIVARPGFCRVSLRPLAVALALAFAGGGLAAPPLPVGGQVVGGSGSISQSGTTLTVQQNSARLSANWQSFDIAAGHSVVFIQPSANAVALNRVLGGSRSEIYGNLSANGQVFLINPNGVLFRKTAEVNVGSLLATTRDISDTDFMAGRYRFTDTGGKGDVVNQGNLKAVDGGFVVLAGTRVSNEGTISATGGTVALAAGETIALDLDSGGQLKVRVDGAVLQALTENRGLIEADGGQVFLTARGKDMLQSSAINLTGVIRARGIREKNGVVVLDGGDDGAVLVDGGRIDVSSDTGHGGTAVVSGRLIGVVDGALIDAAGRDGGGRVIIGGDLLGKVSEILSVRLADRTVVDGSARIRIGAALGDGGFVETSGRCVAIDGTIDGASAGTAGRWLIDPLNVTIGAADANGSWSGGAPNIFTPSATGSTVSAASIQTALNAGTAVEVTTGSTGSEAGDITLLSSITKTAGGDTSLTLTAAGSINTNGGINVTSGQLATTFNANGGTISGSGGINTNGGLLTLNAASGFGILNSVISGTGGLRKTGAGTQVIMVGFYTGATTVNAGTLQVGFGASGNSISAASAVTVDAGATMAWNSANNSTPVTIGNALSGAGTVLLKGSNNSSHTGYSTYSLTGNNAGFSGTLVLNSAMLAGVTAQSQLGTAAIDVQTNSTLGLTGATIANAITVENGAGWYASNGYVYGALRLEGNNTLNGNIITRQTGPTLGDVSGANTTVGSYGGGNSTINGVISGPGGFSMSHATGGDDTTKATTNITLAGNQSNTYGGKTVVDGQGGVISLILAKTGGAVAIPGGTTVQMGNRSDTAGGANLRMGADNQFGPGVVLNMVGSAWGVNVDLLGTSQTLAGITGGTASALAPGFIENQGVDNVVPAGKVYDGLLAASGSTLSASVTGGLVNDDTASLNTAGQSLAFDSAHAGERTINVTGVSTVSVIGGGAGLKDGTAGNATAGQTADYSFISPSVASATATISPKPLAATTTISAVDKVYDGTTLATGSSFTSSVTSGLINGDTAVLNTTGQSLAFDSAHAGSRTVGATGTAVLGPVTGMGSGARDGSSPGNEVAGQNSDYNLMPFVCTPATASITPKTLTLTGASISGADKTYDGLVAATGSTLVTGTVTGFVGADTGAADPGALSLVFNSEHVTAATTISATGNVDYTLNGAARGTGSGTSVGNEVAGLRSDYSFTPPPIAPVAGNITPRGIAAVTGITAEDKRFDASTAAILNTSGASFSGMVAGDALTVSTATGDFDTASPGTNKTVSIVGIALGGASASDYRLLDTTATTFADILPTPVASVETITSSITPTSAVIGLALGQNVAAPVDTALVVVPAIKEGPAASGTQYRITVTESAESKPLLLANDAIGQSGHLRCVGGALRVPNNVRQTVAPCTSGGE
ncbi:filamentous hemagglutinin N-terminal domain-containing protein [uncultured Propionivibrio sp.]|uniref:beta strand repeat-containing protein n=1 Tax=uncultured Propionivibrio sp. TaxID=426737 RepID=UPI0029BFEB88|nr:YDG domain-containing protein [uncultured Propionivibrio sp.]